MFRLLLTSSEISYGQLPSRLDSPKREGNMAVKKIPVKIVAKVTIKRTVTTRIVKTMR